VLVFPLPARRFLLLLVIPPIVVAEGFAFGQLLSSKLLFACCFGGTTSQNKTKEGADLMN